MKNPRNKVTSSRLLQRAAQLMPPSVLTIALGIALLAIPRTARPATTWDADTGTAGAQDGTGTWDTATANWWNGSTDVLWPNTTNDVAVFGAGSGAAGTVTVVNTNVVNGLIFNAPGSVSYTITGGKLNFGGLAPFITMNAAAIVSSVIMGTNGLTLAGAQSINFQQTANTYTGGLLVKSGAVTGQTGANCLGASSGTVTLGDTAGAANVTLSIGTSATIPNAFSVPSGNSGAIQLDNFSGSYSPIFSGAFTLNKNLTVRNKKNSSANTVTVSGRIAGPGSLTITAAAATAPVKLSGSNTFSGGLTLSSGTLAINSTNALGSGPLTMANGTMLDNSSSGDLTNLVNNSQVWNGGFIFIGTRNLDLGSGSVTLGASSQVTVTNNLEVKGVISGAGMGLTKAGPGTLKLGGANTYSGSTTISAGTLALRPGASLDLSSVSVASGATFDVSTLGSFNLGNGTTLTGSGTVNGSVSQQSGATISPGSGTGTLTVSGTTTLNQGGNLAYDLSNDPITGVNDLLSVGALNCVGTNTVSLKPTGTDFGSGSYTLINYGSLTAGGASYFNVFTPATQSRRTFVFDTSTFGQVKLNVGGSPLATLYWAGDGLANIWNYNSSAIWTNGAALDVFKQLDTVVFDDTGSTVPAVNVVGALYPNSVTFSNQSVNYTLAGGGSINSQSPLNMQGSGSVTLAGSGSNSFPSAPVANGTLILSNATAVVSPSLFVFGGNSFLGLSGGFTYKSVQLLQLGGKNTEIPVLVNVSGTNVWQGAATMNSGGGIFEIRSDSGKLIMNGGITCVPTGGRTLYLEGDADGEIKGAIANGAATVAVTKYGGGTWTLSGTNTYSGATTVGSLTPTTGGKLVVNGQIGGGAVTVYSGTLAGYGSISVPVTIYDNLDLGSAIGTLTIANTLSLQSTVNLKIARNGSTVTNDQIAGLSTVTYGGTLNLATNSSDTLHVGDTFKLFSAASYAGAFATINYPVGYTFTNRLAVDGTIAVLTAPVTVPTTPTNLTFSVTGGVLNLSWPAAYLGWSLQVQTNNLSNGLGTNWVTIPGSELVTSTNLPIVVTNGAVFYRMKYVP